MTNFVLTDTTNLFDGGADADTFAGPGGGDDVLNGLGGNDTFTLESGQVGVVNGGGDTDTVIANNNFFEQALTFAQVENLIAMTTNLYITAAQFNQFSSVAAGAGGTDFYAFFQGAGGTLDFSSVYTSPQILHVEAALTDSAVTIIGTNQSDNLLSSLFDDAIFGRGGNDFLFGIGGNDTMVGGAGGDELSGFGGIDRYRYDAASDSGMTVGTRDTIFTFEVGVDKIDLDRVDANSNAGGLQHFAWLGTAAHTGAGATLRYSQTGGGNTIIYGDINGDGAGDFSILLDGLHDLTAADFTNGSISSILGTTGADVLDGAPGGKLMAGFEGNDSIYGGAGADTIQGGQGFDDMTGNAGFDVYDFNAVGHIGLNSGARDTISGFQQGVDKIDLSDIDANTTIAGNQAFSFIGTAPHTGAGATLRYAQSGGNTLVYGDVDANGTGDFALQLFGLYNLTAADFVL